jgi:hypothetical protein
VIILYESPAFVGFWTAMIGHILQSANQTGAQILHNAWANNSLAAAARRKYSVCLLGKAFFQGQAATHQFAAQTYNKETYTSWLTEAEDKFDITIIGGGEK